MYQPNGPEGAGECWGDSPGLLPKVVDAVLRVQKLNLARSLGHFILFLYWVDERIIFRNVFQRVFRAIHPGDVSGLRWFGFFA